MPGEQAVDFFGHLNDLKIRSETSGNKDHVITYQKIGKIFFVLSGWWLQFFSTRSLESFQPRIFQFSEYSLF